MLAGLLLSSYATNWIGLHLIFGAFLFGVVMPREAVLGLREEILVRLEQISVLVLLPIYFVVAGLSINLSMIGHSGLVELSAILVVAIAGKLAGAYGGAQIAGIRGRNAGVMATLMNTRGLTELVILGVGLQLHILNNPLYSLMVIMALVTTAMSGPLLKAIYPDRVMNVWPPGDKPGAQVPRTAAMARAIPPRPRSQAGSNRTGTRANDPHPPAPGHPR